MWRGRGGPRAGIGSATPAGAPARRRGPGRGGGGGGAGLGSERRGGRGGRAGTRGVRGSWPVLGGAGGVWTRARAGPAQELRALWRRWGSRPRPGRAPSDWRRVGARPGSGERPTSLPPPDLPAPSKLRRSRRGAPQKPSSSLFVPERVGLDDPCPIPPCRRRYVRPQEGPRKPNGPRKPVSIQGWTPEGRRVDDHCPYCSCN